MSTIAIDARELRTSTGRYVERLLHYLQDVDSENDYLVLLKPDDIKGWQPHNKRFKTIACPYKEFTFAEQLGFLKQLNSLKPDLVHFCLTQQPVLYRGKTITTVHDLTTARFRNPAKNPVIFFVKQQVYKLIIHLVARKSSAIFTASKFVKDDLANYTHIDPQKIIVTYESADPITEDAKPLQALVGKQFIMYVGRPQPHKNLPRLIEAFGILKQSFPELILVLAGKKDTLYEQIAKDVLGRGIKDVVFTGFVSEGELRWLYQNTACYVFPSLSEGFGLPGLEAMLHGAPVASSNVTCLPEIYQNGAAYFDPLDTHDLSTVVAKIITDQVYANKLRTSGRERATCFSWKKMANISFLEYQKALAKK